MSHYVDVHTHLTHDEFREDLDDVLRRAAETGLKAIVVNGLEPASNRRILQMAESHPLVKAALGIYPVDAANRFIEDGTLPFIVRKFDVDEELRFIRAMAAEGKAEAVGECGIDAYWVWNDAVRTEQTRVFEACIAIASDHSIPIIVHSRKAEQLCFDVLKGSGIRRVNMHCFGGKVKLAERMAEEGNFWFSIPANARRSESFTKMLKVLPMERLLTETDAPYLSRLKGVRSEPADVADTVLFLSEIRGITLEDARQRVWSNFQELFGT